MTKASEPSTAMTDFPNEYEQGRRARLSAVDAKDAPFDTGSPQRKAWDEGFDAAGAEAARNETMTPASADGHATGQLATVAAANSAKK